MDSIPVVANKTSESLRLVSPPKLTARQSTPLRNSSAPRSNSASKTKLILASSASHQTLRANSSRSHRKVRQWENDNFYGIHKYLTPNGDEEEEDFEQIEHRHRLSAIDFRSTLGKLFESNDYDTLNAFRNCQDGFSIENTLRKKKIILPPHMHSFVEAHRAWINIEKKLRNVVFASIKCEYHLLGYILDVESVIKHFAKSMELYPEMKTLTALNAQLDTNIEIDEKYNSIKFDLRDSRLARLMLMIVIKFYCCNHKTSEGNSGSTIFSVTLPKRIPIHLTSGISIFSYLVASLKCEEYVVLQSVRNDNSVKVPNNLVEGNMSTLNETKSTDDKPDLDSWVVV